MHEATEAEGERGERFECVEMQTTYLGGKAQVEVVEGARRVCKEVSVPGVEAGRVWEAELPEARRVHADEVRRRVEAEKREQRAGGCGEGETLLPPTGPERVFRWEGSVGQGVWQDEYNDNGGEGFSSVGRREMWEDPLLRVFARLE